MRPICLAILLSCLLSPAIADSIVISSGSDSISIVVSGRSRLPAGAFPHSRGTVRATTAETTAETTTRITVTPRAVTQTTVEKVTAPRPATSARIHMRWNIRGNWSPAMEDTRRHLETEHGVSTAGMTHQQMLDLHDAIHEGRRVTSRAKTTAMVKRGGGCPGGMCPSPTTGQQISRIRGVVRGGN